MRPLKITVALRRPIRHNNTHSRELGACDRWPVRRTHAPRVADTTVPIRASGAPRHRSGSPGTRVTDRLSLPSRLPDFRLGAITCLREDLTTGVIRAPCGQIAVTASTDTPSRQIGENRLAARILSGINERTSRSPDRNDRKPENRRDDAGGVDPCRRDSPPSH